MFRTAHTDAMGEGAEWRFHKLCVERGMKVSKASKFDDMKRHFDFKVSPFADMQSARVEVKSIKCPKRGNQPDDRVIFVELVNVVGQRGWVFGDADFVAFEQNEGFLIVNREELAHKTVELSQSATMGTQSGQIGKLWNRVGRQDLVLCLDRDTHIKSLPHFFFS